MSIKKGNFLSLIVSILNILELSFIYTFVNSTKLRPRGFFHWSKSPKFKSFKDSKPYPDFQSGKLKLFKYNIRGLILILIFYTLPFSLTIAVLDIEKQLTFIYSSDFKTVSSTFVFTLVTSCFLKPKKKCLLINLWWADKSFFWSQQEQRKVNKFDGAEGPMLSANSITVLTRISYWIFHN